ncbi:macro domain-containing protein [Streptomyces gardneri]|uniref:macro domain-containing protein n=1 Tax=Streptomyces gardneri TaxID=66892 RepID=UPI0036A18276
MQQNAREALLTRQGLGEISAASLASFGLLSAVFQIALAVWPTLARHDVWILTGLAGSCLVAGIIHTWPKLETNHRYRHPDFTIQVKCGDVLDEEGNLIVGFTDTFDTEMHDDVVISHQSVQGQFQERYYGGDVSCLDSDINEKLQNTPVLCSEIAVDKTRGKLERYPIGTTVTLTKNGRRIYLVAYGYMRNDLRVSCSVDALWQGLTSAWDAVRTSGSLEPVAIPVIGSDLARIGSLDRASLIKMIALSFAASSRQDVVSRRLTIVVHPKDRHGVNMVDVEKFLKSL